MTSKEKAKELIEKFDLPSGLMSTERKQCALIAVDEIMEFLIQASEYLAFPEQIKYWQEVKQEIQKL